jgi:hypothetical protein
VRDALEPTHRWLFPSAPLAGFVRAYGLDDTAPLSCVGHHTLIRGSRRARLTARLLVLASVGLLSGCGLIGGSPAARSLTLDLPVTRSEAVRRTLTAFREQGYAVRASLTSGLNPETEPFRQNDAEAVFRAEISDTGSRSRVVLSGTYHTRQFGGIARSGEHEVRNGDDPIERALWSRLEQLRLAIKLQ